jgi:hypothetical protein
MLSSKIRTIILTTLTLAAVSAPGVASAATRSGIKAPPVVKASSVVALEAFPAGGKGSGSEKTCELHTEILNLEAERVREARYAEFRGEGTAMGVKMAEVGLETAKDSALEDGCAVID